MFNQTFSLLSLILLVILRLVDVSGYGLIILLFFPAAFLSVGLNTLFKPDNLRSFLLKLCFLIPGLGAAIGFYLSLRQCALTTWCARTTPGDESPFEVSVGALRIETWPPMGRLRRWLANARATGPGPNTEP